MGIEYSVSLNMGLLSGSPYIREQTGMLTGQRSDKVKFYLILVYLCWYTIKLLLTESSIHTRNISSDAHSTPLT